MIILSILSKEALPEYGGVPMNQQRHYLKLLFILCILFVNVSKTLSQTINEDLFVIGSQCLGNDCTGSEHLIYDTLRLKTNNVRVMFQDTSGLPGFANNDWQIRINSSPDGGQNAFFIDDLGPDSDGSANDSPLFTPFTIESMTPTHTLYLRDNGWVGLGTSTPLKDLQISSINPELMLYDENDDKYGILQYNNGELAFEGNSEQDILRVDATAPANALVINSTGDVTVGGNLTLTSSRQVKQDIRSLKTAEAVEALNELNPVKFRYKQNPEEESIGFIAEEVPNLVATNSRKSINPMDLVAVLTKVVQDQQQINEALTQRIAHLEKQACLQN